VLGPVPATTTAHIDTLDPFEARSCLENLLTTIRLFGEVEAQEDAIEEAA